MEPRDMDLVAAVDDAATRSFRHRDLAEAADALGIGLDELFIACFARGSNFDRPDLEAMVLGLAGPDVHDHDLVALALNELAAERGSDARVRYSDNT